MGPEERLSPLGSRHGLPDPMVPGGGDGDAGRMAFQAVVSMRVRCAGRHRGSPRYLRRCPEAPRRRALSAYGRPNICRLRDRSARGIGKYYIHDDEGLGYPIWYAAPLFEVVHPALSRHWVCTYEVDDSAVGTLVLALPGWAHDRFFYNDLVDGQPAAVRTYEKVPWAPGRGGIIPTSNLRAVAGAVA